MRPGHSAPTRASGVSDIITRVVRNVVVVVVRHAKYVLGMTPKRHTILLSKINHNGDCHRWTGYCDRNGYGIFFAGQLCVPRVVKVHRYMYEHVNGVSLDPWVAVRHRCGSRSCVNPDHLYIDYKRKKNPNAHKNRQRGPRPHVWKWGPDPTLKDMNLSFLRMRAQCKYRNEPFELTFDDYRDIWSGSWHRRGRTNGSLNITRIHKDEPWTRSNTHLVTRINNLDPYLNTKKNKD
jgi:hypothetical protein